MRHVPFVSEGPDMRTVLTAPIALLFATSALAQAPAWHVSEVSGDVRIVENGRAHPAARGALVPAGATVTTAAGARAVIVRAHDYVIVSPASQVRVPTTQQQGGSGLFQMIADAGTALFRIEHQATPHFGVRTPYLAAVVKGTVFTVTVGERTATVQVTEGAVQVSTVDGGAAEMIRPGMVASISAADLRLLHIEGETGRDIRSNGSPSAGVATVPAAEAGRYQGPAETQAAVATTVAEGPVSLADATGGLVAGSVGGDRAFANIEAAARTDNHGGHDGAGSGQGSSGQGNAGNGSAGDNAGNGSGTANGGGNGNAGTAGGSAGDNAGNGNSGSGNGNGGNGNAGHGNGGGSDDAGNGNGNAGDGKNGHGTDDDGTDDGNPGHGGHGKDHPAPPPHDDPPPPPHHGHDDPPPPPAHDDPPPPPGHDHDDPPPPPPGHDHDDPPPPPPGHDHDDPPPPPGHGHDDPPPPPGHGHDDPPPPPGHDRPPPPPPA
jgi:hypothetical protein